MPDFCTCHLLPPLSARCDHCRRLGLSEIDRIRTEQGWPRPPRETEPGPSDTKGAG
jgi:hypothetical protein